MALFATAAGVRYCWRNADARATTRPGARRCSPTAARSRAAASRRRRRRSSRSCWWPPGRGDRAVFTGGRSGPSAELAGARAANLRLDDLPAGWARRARALLGALFGKPGKVVTPSPTTQPAATSQWGKIRALFQGCVGGQRGARPGLRRGRPAAGLPGDVGDLPRDSADGGVDVASTSQYYATTTMVKRDVAEMSEPRLRVVLRRGQRRDGADLRQRLRAARRAGGRVAAGHLRARLEPRRRGPRDDPRGRPAALPGRRGRRRRPPRGHAVRRWRASGPRPRPSWPAWSTRSRAGSRRRPRPPPRRASRAPGAGATARRTRRRSGPRRASTRRPGRPSAGRRSRAGCA